MNVKQICDYIELNPRTLVEIGAAHPTTYRLEWYVKNNYKVILVEANPRLHYCLTEGWNENDFKETWTPQNMIAPPPPYQNLGLKQYKNVQVINAAITDKNGPIKLYERNSSTFVEGVKSPARVNDGYQENDKDAYIVNGLTIDKIDDGEIDVLLSDTEGCEWFCIKNLISRPKLIVLELRGQGYVNPYFNQIMDWMTINRYAIVGYNQTDFFFVRLQ